MQKKALNFFLHLIYYGTKKCGFFLSPVKRLFIAYAKSSLM